MPTFVVLTVRVTELVVGFVLADRATVMTPDPVPEAPEVMVAEPEFVDADHAQPLGATTPNVSVCAMDVVVTLPGLTTMAGHDPNAGVASEISVMKASSVPSVLPAGSTVEVTGKPPPLL